MIRKLKKKKMMMKGTKIKQNNYSEDKIIQLLFFVNASRQSIQRIQPNPFIKVFVFNSEQSSNYQPYEEQ